MPKLVKRVLLLGPQGSGKTTQGDRIAQFLDVEIIVAGNILREAIRSKSEFGVKIANTVNGGGMIPDQWMIDLMMQNINKEEYKYGFILDGFPRTITQAKALDKHQNAQLDKVFNIEISDEEAVKRLSQRRLCPNGHVYHLIFNLPKKDGICDICGGPLAQRADDEEATVKKRLGIYRHETMKLLDYYDAQGKLVVFDGAKNIPLVTDDILNYLKNV
jgi:adenylate kinase